MGKTIRALIILTITALIIPAKTVNAQQQPSLSVAPAIGEWLISPGQKQQKIIQITNESASPLPIRAVAKSMVVQEDVKEADRHLFDASSWFSISEPHFILRAGERKKVAVELQVPRSAEAGGHYASIDFEQLSLQSPSREGQTRTASRISTLAFVVVQGKIEKRLRLDGGLKTTQENGRLHIQLKLQNTGNVHVMPAGNVTITNIVGQKVATLPLPAAIVLPHTSRSIGLFWEKAPRFGYYTATVEVAYGEQHTTMREARGFWLLPWHPALTFFPILLIALYGAYRIRRRITKAWHALWRD